MRTDATIQTLTTSLDNATKGCADKDLQLAAQAKDHAEQIASMKAAHAAAIQVGLQPSRKQPGVGYCSCESPCEGSLLQLGAAAPVLHLTLYLEFFNRCS